MLFPHHLLVMARRTNLSDRARFERLCTSLLADREAPPDFPTILKHFLEQLPPPGKMVKIFEKLWSLTEEAHAVMNDVQWWDIVHHQRILVAVVERDGFEIDVTFIWRETKKTELGIEDGLREGICRLESTTGRLSVEFEARTYQCVKASYVRWLSRPIATPLRAVYVQRGMDGAARA